MFDILIQNVQLVSILILTYLGSMGVNTLLGIYYNLKTAKEEFSVQKLITGLIRGGIILLSGLVITAVISLLPAILSSFGITSTNDMFENLSVIGMAGVLVSTIVRYMGDALKKFYAILGSYPKNSEVEEEA